MLCSPEHRKSNFIFVRSARWVCILLLLMLANRITCCLAWILHECANLAGIRDICAVAGRDSFDRAGTGSFDAVFGL